MEQFLALQIEYLLLLQNFREITGGVLDNFFMFITSCGEITIPALLTAGIYWCINSRNGRYIFFSWCVGTIACQFLKTMACIYRPWVLDSRVHPIESAIKMAGGYSFPSGHTQTATSIYGGIAKSFNNKFLRMFLIVLILLIAFSRNYIGVHTPQDVIVALVLGVAVLFFTDKMMNWVDEGKNRDLAVLLGVIFSAAALLIYQEFKVYPMDYVDGNLLVDPQKMCLSSFPKIGLYFGIFSGWVVERRFIKFDAKIGTIKEKIVRFIVGAIILGFISSQTTHLIGGGENVRFVATLISFSSGFFTLAIYPALIIFVRKKILKKTV